MGINMELPNEADYNFLDFTGLAENITIKIKAILRSEIASDVLKLPWDNGDKDCNSNSVVPEISEHSEDWQRYGMEEAITPFEIVGTTSSMMPTSMPGPIPYNGAIVAINYGEWTLSGNTYPNSGTCDPSFQYMPNIQYTTRIYSPNEVINASPSRDNDRRGGRGRNRKNETYNRVMNPNDLQASYLMSGQFNQIPQIYHPTVTCMSYAMAPQQHPASGRPIFMQPQYNPSSMHAHNNNPQYTHPGYSTHTTSNQKHLTRQSSGQNYYNQDNTSKNNPNIHSKTHDKKIYDNNSTAMQSFRQLPNNSNDYEMSKKNKSSVNNNNINSSSINNGHTTVVTAKNDVEPNVKDPLIVETKSTNDNCVIDNKESPNFDQSALTTLVTRDIVKPIEVMSTSNEQPVLPTKPVLIESPTTIPKINGEDIKDDDIVIKKVAEESVIVQENKPTSSVVSCVSPVSLPAQTPSSYAGKTFASILKKPTGEIRAPQVTHQVTKSQTVRSNLSDSSVDADNATRNHQQDVGAKRRSVTVTHDGEPSTKTVYHSAFSDRKKSLKNSVHTQSCDPAVYRIGEFLQNYQMDKHTVSLLPRGLTNRSNYCYINSILQALLACPPFYNLLKALPYSRHPSKNSTTPLIDNMVKFVNEFDPLPEAQRLPRKDLRAQKKSEDAAIDIQTGIAFEPSYVYTMLKNASCAGVFSVEGRQEDAEEFLSCLLNGISDEMLELMKQVGDNNSPLTTAEPNVNYTSSDEEWKVMGPRNKGSITRCTEFGKTPLSDIFRGQLRSRIIRQGEESTDNVQPFFTLQLDIEKIDSVTDALETLVAKDQVEGMTCSKTKKQINAWKQVTLEELPIILILHLKWFDYKLDGCSKIFKNVTYGIDLKFDSKFLSVNIGKKLTGKQRQYKLFAVTYHDGKEATKGHYVTDAFHVGYGAWVRYDDSSVKGVSENDVLNPTIPRVPYLLYYRRCDTIGSNQSNNSRTR